MTVEQFVMIALGILIECFTFALGLIVGASMRADRRPPTRLGR
jgi:hypothetical protein